jgi:hypothetical protein
MYTPAGPVVPVLENPANPTRPFRIDGNSKTRNGTADPGTGVLESAIRVNDQVCAHTRTDELMDATAIAPNKHTGAGWSRMAPPIHGPLRKLTSVNARRDQALRWRV